MINRRKNLKEVAANLCLPPKVTMVREAMPSGVAYIFRHAEFGELGRILVEGTPNGESRLTCEIAGFEADPMFARRRDMLEPLSLEICKVLEAVGGQARDAPLPPPSQQPAGRIPVEEVRCLTCGDMVAILIFADDATDQGRFEDYARLLFPNYSQHKVPTYIIGPELGTGPTNYRADIQKIWPKKGDIETLRPEQFRPTIDTLVFGHCK